MVRHIEGGVVALDIGQRHGLREESAPYLFPVPELDIYVLPCGAAHIYGGGRAQHVEGYAVVLCKYGYAAGAYFVCCVAVGGYPVAAHHAALHPAVFHDY